MRVRVPHVHTDREKMQKREEEEDSICAVSK